MNKIKLDTYLSVVVNNLCNMTCSHCGGLACYDFTGNLQCNINCTTKSNHYFNNTLGWLMGYKLPYLSVDASGNTASSVLDLNGPKYLILVFRCFLQFF